MNVAYDRFRNTPSEDRHSRTISMDVFDVSPDDGQAKRAFLGTIKLVLDSAGNIALRWKDNRGERALYECNQLAGVVKGYDEIPVSKPDSGEGADDAED